MNIALTGATGFLGSALASQFLKAGCSVLALVRSDATGDRTRRAIKAAVLGLGGDPSELDWSKLIVRQLEWDAEGCKLDLTELAGITCVWHTAAEMSYSSAQLPAAFKQNVGASHDLYRLFAEHAPRCQRFYYVSTAYTAGFDCVDVAEQLHLAPRVINVYQASKWAAELSLATAQRSSGLPLTIFRPTIIIGDEKTGWYGSKEFGMYSISRGLYEMSVRRADTITMPINERASINLIPINRVVAYALALSRHARPEKPFEVMHAAAAEAFPLGQALAIAGSLLGMTIQSGEPHSALDRMFARSVRDNQQFAQGQWRFATGQLAEAVGADFQPYLLEVRTLEHLLLAYFVNLPPAETNPEAKKVRAQQLDAHPPAAFWTRWGWFTWRQILSRWRGQPGIARPARGENAKDGPKTVF